MGNPQHFPTQVLWARIGVVNLILSIGQWYYRITKAGEGGFKGNDD